MSRTRQGRERGGIGEQSEGGEGGEGGEGLVSRVREGRRREGL